MKRALKTFSIIVVCLFSLSFFGWMVSQIVKGDRTFGFLKGPIEFMYGFPDLFSQSVEEVSTLPATFIPTPADFLPINLLEEDLLLLSTFSDSGDSRSIVLRNLRNDSILHRWKIENPFREHDRIINPLLLEDKSLVYAFDGVSGLRRIDSLGNLIWKQDSVYAHHGMNLDRHGNIWICSFEHTYEATGWYMLEGRTVFVKDNFLSCIDSESGAILSHRSILGILRDNNLENYILKTQVVTDPLHHNDVEPALVSGPHFKADDLFLSLRSSSSILHYRPSTNKIVDVIEGPFASQHDPDLLDDSSMVIFNNNYYPIRSFASRTIPQDSSWLEWAGDFYSNLLLYNFNTGTYSELGDSVFRANQIFSESEGLVEFIGPDTYFVEEQNSSILWVIEKDKVVYKGVFASQHKGYHHLANWNRVIQHYE